MTELPRRDFLGGLLAAAAPPPAAAGIRVGCQTRVYGVPIRDTRKLLSILDDLRAAGYLGFETNFASLEASFADPAPLRAEFEKRRVGLIGLHLGARLTQPDQIEKEQARIERVARAVKGFGGTHLVLSGSGIPTTAGGKLDLEILKRKAREFSRAGKICRDLGIRLASHNHLQETERNGEEMIAVLSATDPQLVSLLLDIGYTHLARLDAPAFIKKCGARIDGFHVRDYRGKQEAPMGQGEVDLRGLARALAETRWAGWVILEMNTMREVSSRDLVAGARAYMKKEMNF